MTTHIYAFGSICRGDVSLGSDVDLLALVSSRDDRFSPDVFSIYSHRRIEELWRAGNPFAWHLAIESRLLFTSDGDDPLKRLGKPAQYDQCVEDCSKFRDLYQASVTSATSGAHSAIFDLSMIFLSIRNIATCYSLGVTRIPNFSRRSALQLGKESVPLSEGAYETLERARILSTRGWGVALTTGEIARVMSELQPVAAWMKHLVEGTQCHERVQ